MNRWELNGLLCIHAWSTNEKRGRERWLKTLSQFQSLHHETKDSTQLRKMKYSIEKKKRKKKTVSDRKYSISLKR